MAIYRCHCGDSADVFLRQVRDVDGQPTLRGRSWAACQRHIGQALREFVGTTVQVRAVAPSWQAHVARRRAENALCVGCSARGLDCFALPVGGQCCPDCGHRA